MRTFFGGYIEGELMCVQWSFALFTYFCLLLLALIYFVKQMIGVYFVFSCHSAKTPQLAHKQRLFWGAASNILAEIHYYWWRPPIVTLSILYVCFVRVGLRLWVCSVLPISTVLANTLQITSTKQGA